MDRPDTNGLPGYVQANLAIVPKELAFEFLTFCFRNCRPCPVLDVTDPGNPHPTLVASEADLRTDVPRYRVPVKPNLSGDASLRPSPPKKP